LLVSPIFCLSEFGDRGDESIEPAGTFEVALNMLTSLRFGPIIF
jgi:hypothetical protein